MQTTALVFACHSKACAPPPTGRGGSSPASHGLKVDTGYMPKMSRFTQSKIEVVDPKSLVATQDWLKGRPSMAKITAPGHAKPPDVYEDPETGIRYIGDGHHRVVAHAAAGRQVRVKVWSVPK